MAGWHHRLDAYPVPGIFQARIPPPPDKDLESPSSTRLEALVPSRDSRARTRSPSPRAWCGARGGFLPRHDEDLREPLVRCQGSQVSMRVARVKPGETQEEEANSGEV